MANCLTCKAELVRQRYECTEGHRLGALETMYNFGQRKYCAKSQNPACTEGMAKTSPMKGFPEPARPSWERFLDAFYLSPKQEHRL